MAVSIRDFDEEYIKELATIEIAYHIIKEAKTTFHFKQLAEEIKNIKKIDDDRLYDVLPQLYTELNLDGRFLHLGKNEWALKSWYSVAAADELLKVREIYDEEDEEEEEAEDEIVELLDDDPVVSAKKKKKGDFDVEEEADEELSDDDDVDTDLDDLADEDLDYAEDEAEDEIEEVDLEDAVYYIDEEFAEE